MENQEIHERYIIDVTHYPKTGDCSRVSTGKITQIMLDTRKEYVHELSRVDISSSRYNHPVDNSPLILYNIECCANIKKE